MIQKIRKYSPFLLLCLFFALFLCSDLWAQCPMCRAAAESNLKEGGTYAKGLNKGILYLFVTPYLLAATVGTVWWYLNYKRTGKSLRADISNRIS